VKFKLDENLSPALTQLFGAHDVHSVAQEGLGGQADLRVIDVCCREQRALVTLDLDFANIVAYPPASLAGVVVLRLGSQSHPVVESALRRMLALVPKEPLTGMLWIVEEDRIRIHG
jgi:predicted nuclease of predicted toxin-antitoxin system